jgi:hypothetical protein
MTADGQEEGEAGSHCKPLSTSCSAQGAYNNINMTGSEIFKFAVRAVPKVRPWTQTSVLRPDWVLVGHLGPFMGLMGLFGVFTLGAQNIHPWPQLVILLMVRLTVLDAHWCFREVSFTSK